MWARRGRIFIWDIRFGHYVSKFDDDMDYKRALFEGPWLVGDHYVISEEWKPNFEPGYSQVNTIWAWVRLSGIPLEYFDDGILRSIGDKIGKTVKVANTTLFGLRGNYARVCVEIDLHKPFVSKYRLNRRVHRVEYEGLHEICFTCERYGHGQGGCPSKVSNDPVDQENTFFNPIFSDGDSRPELEEEYGPWMKAKKKVRRSRQPNLPEAKAGKDKEPENVGSRFNVLTEEEEETIIVVDLEPMQESDTNVGPAPKGTLGSKQASAMEKPNRRLEFSPNQQRVSSDSKLTTQTGSVRTGNKKEETSKVDKTGEMQMGTGRGTQILSFLNKLSGDESKCPPVEPSMGSVGSAASHKNKGSGPKVSLSNDKQNQIPVRKAKSKAENGQLMDGTSEGGAIHVSPQPLNHPMIKVFSWNCRGASHDNFFKAFKSYMKEYSPEVVILVEPKISGAKAEKVCSKLGFDEYCRVEAVGFSGGIWVLWHPSNVILKVIEMSNQILHLEGGSSGEGSLSDTRVFGPKFTWYRGPLAERLDRAIVNDAWLLRYPFTKVQHLNRLYSDHIPILVHCKDIDRTRQPRPFRFMAPWLGHPSFRECVKNVWTDRISLPAKPVGLAVRLKRWNKENFGNIFKWKQDLLNRLKEIEEQQDGNHSSILTEEENSTCEQLEITLGEEELLWIQKARQQNIVEGDRNTAFYHKATLRRRAFNRISRLKNNEGEWIEEDEALLKLAVEFFSESVYRASEAIGGDRAAVNSKELYQYLIERIDKKLTGWKVKALSTAGRVTLAIPVLNTLPTYLMQTTLLPVEICNAIDKKIWDFIWGSFNGERKMHMINWETICIPNNQGGLGLRSARELNQAYLMKLVWGLIKNPTELWADLLISKYMKRTPTGLSPRQAVRKSSYWRGISDNWEMFRGGLRWSIHNGKKTNFWR
ncbi:Putative ribonuclease H protein At1g65750 [Linum perenne]